MAVDHLGVHYATIEDMLKYYSVPLGTYQDRKRSGKTLEECLTGNFERVFGPVKERTDPDGVVYNSAKDMAEAHSVPYGTYSSRRSRGWSIERCLNTPLSRPFSDIPLEERTDHLGQIFPTKRAMLEHHGVTAGQFNHRKSKGKSLEECLTPVVLSSTNASEEERTDHLGQLFPTKLEMCEHHGVTLQQYNNRRSRGLSKKQSLTKCSVFTEPTFDHLGNEYPSKEAMYHHYNMTVDDFRNRKKKGWSLEKILTTPIFKKPQNRRKWTEYELTGLDGVLYKSATALCRNYNLSVSKYAERLDSGWDKVEALTEPVRSAVCDIEERTDHRGRVFKSKKAMLDYYQVDASWYYKLIRNGYTKESILTHSEGRVPNIIPEEERTDPFGTVFATKKAMCEKYGVDLDVFGHRMKEGWTIREALNIDKHESRLVEALSCDVTERTDPFGNVFPTKKEMCSFYQVPVNTFTTRRKRGQTVKQALGLEYAKRNVTRNQIKNCYLMYVDKDRVKYFMCLYSSLEEEVLTEEELKEKGLLIQKKVDPELLEQIEHDRT